MYEQYLNDIPVGRENKITYADLCAKWAVKERKARDILHALSLYDNGDNYIIIRSSRNAGFYRTDDEAEITSFKKECLNKGRSCFAPVKKINRVLNVSGEQYSLVNNLRVIRESKGLKQHTVCKLMNNKQFDKSLLSKMENGVCLPTYEQLQKLADIYGVDASELINDNLY